MKPLVMFPAQRNLWIGVAIGAAFVMVGRTLGHAGSSDEQIVTDFLALITLGVGLWTMGSCGYRLASPRPVFEAGPEGFRVMNGKVQPWERFQGVGLHKLKVYGLIPTLSWVVVKMGKGPVFARRKHIKWVYLPGSAADVAEEISAYSWRVRGMNRAQATAVPDLEAVRQVRKAEPQPVAEEAGVRPVRPVRPARPGAAPSGPIQQVPTLGERLFGGSKVR